MASERLRFVIVLPNHQPVGNDPATAAYRPLLAVLDGAPWLRWCSGPRAGDEWQVRAAT